MSTAVPTAHENQPRLEWARAWGERANEVYHRYYDRPSGENPRRNETPLTPEDEAFVSGEIPQTDAEWRQVQIPARFVLVELEELKQEAGYNHDPRFAMDIAPVIATDGAEGVEVDPAERILENQRQAMATALYQFIISKKRGLYLHWDGQPGYRQGKLLLRETDTAAERAEKLGHSRLWIRFTDDLQYPYSRKSETPDELRIWSVGFFIDPSSNFTVPWDEVRQLPQAQTPGGIAFLREMTARDVEGFRNSVESEETQQWIAGWRSRPAEDLGRMASEKQYAMDRRRLELATNFLNTQFPES